MKIKNIVLLLCTLLLSSCGKPGGEDKPTYTITIEQTDHFTPDRTSFTFKEDDFSPIVFSYSTDPSYLVLNAKASEDAAECHVEYQKDNEIEIIPCKNANFTVKVTMTHFSEASIIRIADEKGHFHANRNKIVFKNNDFTPVSVRYIADSYCRVNGAIERNNKAHCEIDSKTSTLTITPKDNGELFIDVSVSELYKIINFDPNGGTLASSAKEQILIPYDELWGLYVDPKTQYAIKDHYVAKGWTFEEDPQIGDGVLAPTYTLHGNDPTTVYAVYQHSVDITSESLEFDSIDYYDGEGDDIRIYFNLKNSDKYELPEAKGSFTVTNSSGETITVSKYERISNIEAYIDIPLSENISDGLIKITVSDYQPEYRADASSIITAEDHLIYSATNAPKRGEDFVFSFEAKNEETNDTNYYYVPNRREQINISVNNGETYSRLSTDAYKIEFAAGDQYYQNGKITVFGEYIKGDLKIDATAAMANGYFFAFTGYGIAFEDSHSNYLSGYYNSDSLSENYELVDDEATTRVKYDNIAVRAITNDGTATWYMLEEFDEKFDNPIIYSEAKKWFTLRDIGHNINSVIIHVFDPNYSIFANASWSQINELCSLSESRVRNLFSVGEEKQNVIIDGQSYTARIIDFYHNTLHSDESKKATLTMEFEQVITDSNGSIHKGRFGIYKCNYFTSEYYDYMMNTFQNKLPTDLLSVSKEVIVPCDSSDVYSRVFPLSSPEINRHDPSSEGSAYSYYLEGRDLRRYTCSDTTKSNPCEYWLRSRKYASECDACYINESGSYKNNGTVTDKRGYIAVFCI